MPKKKGGDSHASITPKEEVKRMNVNVPSSLHHRFKVAALMQRKEMTKVLLEFIEQYADKYAPESSRPAKGGRA